MKKFLVLLLGILVAQNCTIARDYTKIQVQEAKHAQKYNNVDRHFKNYDTNQYFINRTTSVYDPKIIDLGIKYSVINNNDYNERLQQDEEKYDDYSKRFNKITWTNYNAQANGRDYYRIYRIAERIIRANRLDYQTWRFGIVRKPKDYNAFSSTGNYIQIYSSVVDTYTNNDDALALVIGHEIAHALLGHIQRSTPDKAKLERMSRLAQTGNVFAAPTAVVLHRKILIDSKNMEYAADIEGAKLITKAGYDLNKASDALVFMEKLGEDTSDLRSTHPLTRRRLESFNQNRRYFPEKIWKDMGRYNIYNTPVLEATSSSDRCSIVISPSEGNSNPDDFYRPETPEELYTRFGYTAYINGEFEKSLENFDKLFNMGTKNATAYLYASYAANELYKSTGEDKYRKKAKNYINEAVMLAPSNKYIRQQADNL